MARLHPGVYLEEISSGVRPIEGVGTSTAAFVGKAERGAVGRAQRITSFAEFQRTYGGFLSDSFLAHAVFQFFNNGGTAAYVVRVTGSGAQAAGITVRDRKQAAAAALAVSALDEGAWGNALDLEVVPSTADPENLFTMNLRQDRSGQDPPLPSLLLETFPDVGMDPDGPSYVETVVARTSRFIRAQVDAANRDTAGQGTSRSAPLRVGDGTAVLKLGTGAGGTETPGAGGAIATVGTSQSGDDPSTNPRADARRIAVELDGDGAVEIVVDPAAATGADIADSITAAVRALQAKNPANQPAYLGFACTYETPAAPAMPRYVLRSGTNGPGSSVVVTAPANKNGVALGAGTWRLNITVNGDGPHLVTLTGPLADGDAIATALRNAVQALRPHRSANAAALSNFAVKYDFASAAGNPSLVLTSGAKGPGSTVRVTDAPADNVAGLLGLGRTNEGAEVTGGAVLRPAPSQQPTEYHLGDATPVGSVASVVFGADGELPGDNEHVAGLSALDPVTDANIVCVPGIDTVVAAGTNYCTRRMDCFFVGDVGSSDDTPALAVKFVNGLTTKTSYGAVYYPWLRMTDPSGGGEPVPVPPSGFVAGLYARTDSRRGVFKAPAGTEANLAGAVGLLADTSDADQDILNPVGVNAIRAFPAAGLVAWGARTLATLSDAEYRYVPVRRTAIFLEQSILRGIQYAVFEPNDEGLWASLRLNVGSFMLVQFRAGMFQGRTPNDAFFVKCDATTTTQQDVDAGVVNVLVGFAPLKPAEFVVLKITQKTAQGAA